MHCIPLFKKLVLSYRCYSAFFLAQKNTLERGYFGFEVKCTFLNFQYTQIKENTIESEIIVNISI